MVVHVSDLQGASYLLVYVEACRYSLFEAGVQLSI